MRYKLTISYQGTQYSGWMKQPGKRSVIQTLEDAFESVFGSKIAILGASRTDAGVHAMQQMAICDIDLDIPLIRLKKAWNNELPPSISILSLEPAGEFYPLSNVKCKTYYYHVSHERPLPLYEPYVLWHKQPFDVSRLQEALAVFKGTHDFAAFYTGDNRADTIRTIDQICVSYNIEWQCYRIEIVGEKFLRHMIRRMVGAAILYAMRKDTPLHAIIDALHKKEKNYVLPTALAKGLMLKSIEYKD